MKFFNRYKKTFVLRWYKPKRYHGNDCYMPYSIILMKKESFFNYRLTPVLQQQHGTKNNSANHIFKKERKKSTFFVFGHRWFFIQCVGQVQKLLYEFLKKKWLLMNITSHLFPDLALNGGQSYTHRPTHTIFSLGMW